MGFVGTKTIWTIKYWWGIQFNRISNCTFYAPQSTPYSIQGSFWKSVHITDQLFADPGFQESTWAFKWPSRLQPVPSACLRPPFQSSSTSPWMPSTSGWTGTRQTILSLSHGNGVVHSRYRKGRILGVSPSYFGYYLPKGPVNYLEQPLTFMWLLALPQSYLLNQPTAHSGTRGGLASGQYLL